MGTKNLTTVTSNEGSINYATTGSKVAKNETTSITQSLSLESSRSTPWTHRQCVLLWVFCSKSQTCLKSYKINLKELLCLWPPSKGQKWNSGSCWKFTSWYCIKLASREKRKWKMALISSFSLEIMGRLFTVRLSQLTANLFLWLQNVSWLEWSECVRGTHGIGWEFNTEENASIDTNSWQDLMIWP